jgi:hypothetical protein
MRKPETRQISPAAGFARLCAREQARLADADGTP